MANRIEQGKSYLILKDGPDQKRARRRLWRSRLNSVVAVETEGVVPERLFHKLDERSAYQLFEINGASSGELLKGPQFVHRFHKIVDPYGEISEELKVQLLRPKREVIVCR